MKHKILIDEKKFKASADETQELFREAIQRIILEFGVNTDNIDDFNNIRIDTMNINISVTYELKNFRR